jgi:hypothetical protein
MTTRIAENPCPPIAPPHREQWRTEADTFDVVARVRDGRRGNEHAGKRAQHTQLVRESFWVKVILDWFSPYLAFIGRPRVDVSEEAAHDLHVVCHR